MNAQLDLFEGLVLTTEQQKRVDSHIEYQNRRTQEDVERNETIEKLLVEGGFVKGVNFDSNFEVYETTYTKTLGCYESFPEKFDVEVTHMESRGATYIIYPQITNENGVYKIENAHAWVDVVDNKLRCSNLTANWRKYKPSSLLNKLIDKKEQIENKLKYLKTQNAVLEYTISKYQEKYPNAQVSEDEGWNQHTGVFKLVSIVFPSGSYVKLRVWSTKDHESIYKSYDAKEVTGLDLLDYFNEQ